MARECNSEYYGIIKYCRYLRTLKSGLRRCVCSGSCATCTAGATNMLMHPELNQITELSRHEGGVMVGHPAHAKEV